MKEILHTYVIGKKNANGNRTWIQKNGAKVAARLSRHGYRHDINT